MGVAFRSSSTTGTSDAEVASIAVPVPAGAAANDIALVAIEQWQSTSTNPTVTPPAGFTQIVDINLDADQGWQRLKVFWKRLSGADSGSYTFTWTGAQWSQGQAMLITGAKTTGDPIGANVNTATAAAPTTSTPTTTLSGLTFQPFLANFVANESSSTQTPPTSFTETQEANYLKSNYRIPGATGTFSASGGTLSTSTSQVAALIAVEPAASGQSAAANTAAETDAARPVARSKVRGISVAAETDAAPPITRGKTKAAPTALSAEIALPIGKVKSRLVSLASESDASLAIGSQSNVISRPVGTAASVEQALPIGHSRSLAIGTAPESDTAEPIGLRKGSWRLVMPQIEDYYPVRGSLRVRTCREATVFGDENGLETTQMGNKPIPFGTKYIWYGGHVNVTDDPAVKALWLASGFEVETIVS